ncbi:glycosyltransferase [Ramlibacter alkalitolerans]|uniref:Glycosyltransferase n=1 Tax=Ramlibacter alkalitolerans TaxID=2039631 RepID=A0ABS1JUR4_9BURK|nr:glycosyltransferase [Ramlibacter alkalitolerans]MBL0427952.1 glycosyltransferase [Ramlibacter alkalitolerans]
MKILKVIHGYPMRYNAGSEVYSQTLCHALAERHDVHVFTREEDAFAPDFRLRLERDPDDARVTVHIVNNPRLKDRYRATGIDQRFAEVLDRVNPDVVHVGHLNHLSTSMLREAAVREIPILFTLHDYWLMCPRGQFMQMFPEDPNDLWAVCDSQADRKCAERCYARYFSGASGELETDVTYWADWVGRRMRHVREVTEFVDLFIAPSRYLHDRFRDEFNIPESKLVHLDYGFARERMAGRSRVPGERFTFGYIGTHIPAKGIHDLIQAFGKTKGDARLRIWGRPRGQDTDALKEMAASLPAGVASRIEWLPEYRNQEIVRDVFDRCDAIVVPSVWVENSPLVIHEAQQARVPVITAAAGGMAEYVHHEINGLLYEHRCVASMADQMQRLADSPELTVRLGQRGYLYSTTGEIPSIQDHVIAVERLYADVLSRQASARVTRSAGPWRITFDTNPDTCNLRCVMCEEHSPHSILQIRRKEEGRPRRLMPFEMIERVVADAAPHGLREIIPSTMGEPLLYEHFDDILELCRRYKVKLNLTTNGTFPRRGATAWAERIVPVTSDVKISWNGATKATHEAIMLGARWEKVVKNVRDFIAVRDAHAATGGNRCRVTFQLTFLESNVDELADIVRLALRLGVDRIKGHHLWAHFTEIQDQSMRRSPEAIERWNRAVLAAREAAREQTLPNGKYVLLENIFLLDAAAKEDLAPGGPCPFLGQEAWVSAVGRFDPCCAPDAQRRTLGEFGNLDSASFMEIWNGDSYRELTSTYRNRRLCVGCNMRKPEGSKT